MPFVFEKDDQLYCSRLDNQERELTLVPTEIVDSFICYLHEGFGGAHYAGKATAAKII